MKPLVIELSDDSFGPDDVRRAAELLLAGGTGIIPTDTVYGLTASAENEEAVAKVYEIKERSLDKPLPVQVSGIAHAHRLAFVDELALRLMETFWPGALTIVLRKKPDVRFSFLRGDTIGLRVPNCRFCLELINQAGCIVVPSANFSGKAAPVSPEDIDRELLERVDFLVDAGPCPGGIESTVVDATGGVRILREGAIPAERIRSAIGG